MRAAEDDRDLGDVFELLRLVWAVDQALQKTSKRMQSRIGVTGPQRFALRLIGRFPGIALGRLAHLMRVHPSTVTGIVRRLRSRRLVTRRPDPTDARRSFLHLTPEGARRSADRPDTVERAVRRVFAATPPVRMRHAREVLGALTAALEANASPLARRR